MRIEVLYFAGCPNYEQAIELVRSLAPDASIEPIEIATQEEAVRMQFLGSPTIRVDGLDVEEDARTRTDFGFSCRTYGGRGVPSRELIASAIDRCASASRGALRSGWFSGGSVAAAVMASTCCWLPLVLIGFGASAGGMASMVAAYRPLFAAIALVSLAAAYYFTFARPRALARDEDCCAGGDGKDADARGAVAPRRSAVPMLNRAVLGVVTAAVALVLILPRQIGAFLGTEPALRRSAFKIAGMSDQDSAAALEGAIRRVSGVIAVDVDPQSGTAVVGTEGCCPVPHAEILAALNRAGYSGELLPRRPAVIVAACPSCELPAASAADAARALLAVAPDAARATPERAAAGGKPKAASLVDLSDDVRELRTAFNAEKNDVKVLLIVSPVCPMCRYGAKVVQEKALAKIDGPATIFVVWTPRFPGDGRKAAEQATELVSDERAVQFWDGSGALGRLYGRVIKLPRGKTFAWDVYFVFGSQARWADKPPAPDFWMHQLGGPETGNLLDGETFRRAIVERLPSKREAPK